VAATEKLTSVTTWVDTAVFDEAMWVVGRLLISVPIEIRRKK
jgi:hypothetical protein